MRYVIIKRVAPTVEPVTLSQVKEQLRIESGFILDDTYLTTLISVARDRAEMFCNRYFTEQQITINYYNGFPTEAYAEIEIPFPDVSAITAIKYVETDGTEVLLDAGEYTFDPVSQKIKATSNFPSDSIDIKVELTTGAPVEFEGVKQSMLMMITDMYELRTQTVVASSLAENNVVNLLMYPYRVRMGI